MEGQSRTVSQIQQEITSQEMERFFLDYIKQKQIAEGNLPDLGDEEAGQY